MKKFSIGRLDIDFDDASKKLGQNMILTYSDNIVTTNYYSGGLVSYERSERTYHAYPVSVVEKSVANEPIHIRNTDDEIEIKQEFIMEWTINAALS